MKKLLKILIHSLLASHIIVSTSQKINLSLQKKFKEITYVKDVPTNIECILATDIGGTNSNFGVFTLQDDIAKMILSIHLKSGKVKNLADTLNKILKYLENKYAITIKNASISSAGLISADRRFCYSSNVFVDIHEILEKTDLEHAVLSNDFEVIGFGIDLINQQHVVQIKKGKKIENGTLLILGAGTGLGKCTLIWNNKLQRYLSVPSEFGHSDFSPQSNREYELTEFIKKTENRTCNISWQDILSGPGISRIYAFFCKKNNTEHRKLSPAEIFKNRYVNKSCMDTYLLFTKLYAKCAKNLALDTISVGGIYVAGGIAAKNIEMFKQPIFVETFTKSHFHSELLKDIPVYVITDYKISLYGAARFLMLEGLCS